MCFTPPSSAILGQTEGFTIKFCPKDLEKVKPNRSMISRMVPRLVRFFTRSRP